MDECEDGILPKSLYNAPYYYTEIEGDFILKVKVSHDLSIEIKLLKILEVENKE